MFLVLSSLSCLPVFSALLAVFLPFRFRLSSVLDPLRLFQESSLYLLGLPLLRGEPLLCVCSLCGNCSRWMAFSTVVAMEVHKEAFVSGGLTLNCASTRVTAEQARHLLNAYCQHRPWGWCLNQELLPLYLMAVLWRECHFYLYVRLFFPCDATIGVCLLLYEERKWFSHIILCLKIKPFLILLLLNKAMACSFLSKPSEINVCLIFKMLL